MRELTIKRRFRPIDLLHPHTGVQSLPNGPQPIKLRMMQKEHGISRGGVRIEAWVSTPRIITARVRAINRLDDCTKTLEIIAAGRKLVLHGRRPGVRRPNGGNIAFDAAGIVPEAVTMAVRNNGRGTEVNGEGSLPERTLLDTATSRCRRQDKIDAESGDVRGSIIRNKFAITAHGGGGTVEDGAVSGILPGEGPIPVGLSSPIAAFFAEGFLVDMDVVPVERVEEALQERQFDS